ncbi:MAG TPA: hypothetical protein VF519_13045 [Mycobacteriales bacterium]
MPRTLRTAVALAALVTALPLAGGSAAARCPDESRRVRPDGWTALRRPAYSVGEPVLRSWAASPHVDGFLLATNGDAIARSVDGGCSWEETYTPGAAIGETRVLWSSNSIVDVAMPPSPPGRLGYVAYAVITDVDGTRVITSHDRGETWHSRRGVGLPPAVAVHGLWVSPNPATAFVLVDSRSTPLSAVETTLYVTRDTGETFAPVTVGLRSGQYTNLALDPIDATSVWAWDEDSLFHSVNGGAAFAEVDVVGPIATLDVLHYPAFAPARVIVYLRNRAAAYTSHDGGRRWQPARTPGRVTGAANLYATDAVAVASDRGVFLTAPGVGARGPRDVSPKRLTMTDVALSFTRADVTLYGRAGHDLFVRRFTPALQPKLPPVNLRGAAPVTAGPTALRPATKTVRLKPGQRAAVPYSLDLAPVPTPLDIFFATDSTGSMAPVISGLRSDLQDIIDDLGRSGIDVWFGVGDFKDYPGFGSPGDYPYQRRRAVGPIDDDLATAIESISTGGGVTYDSALAATYQAATGEGQPILAQDDTGRTGYLIEPGQGAEWRPEALKVLVIAADVRSRDPNTDPGYPGPSYGKVIAALNRRGIEHVGLAVGDQPAEAFQSLSRVSRGTGTLAPPGGIDCDDDGEVDLLEGEPLVCELPVDSRGSTDLAPAVVGLMRSLRDLQSVGIELAGDRRVARVASAPVFDEVNVKQHNRLPYTVQVACTAETAGKTFPVRVRTRVGARHVASASLTVECEPLPGTPPREVPPPPKAPYVVAAAVPAVAPPPPPPAPIPQAQAQPHSNPNPNPNPQAGMAHQEQAQPELALAYDDVRGDEELAMVGLAAGAMLAAGCAVALRRRAATSTA